MAGGLLFVTQVAPYRDGPAGVHGVLDQAAVGVAQIAEMHGLRARRVDDVRDLPAETIREARALALFTIGETPWSAAQRDAIVERTRAGRLAICSIHSATDSCYCVGRVRAPRRRAVRRSPLDADIRRRRL